MCSDHPSNKIILRFKATLDLLLIIYYVQKLETNDGSFIAKPHFYLEDTKFKPGATNFGYTDILTYVALRSFHNIRYSSCFPALITIASLAGVSKQFVTDSIARLEADGFINVLRSGKRRIGNRYTFPKFNHFDRIPRDIFDCHDLTLHGKAMLLCLREIADTPVDLNLTKVGMTKKLGITYKVLSTQFEHLIKQGYVKRKSSSWYRLERLPWIYSIKKKPDISHKFEFWMPEQKVEKIDNLFHMS